MYEDWVEETLNLLETTASIPDREKIGTVLLQAFNDLEKANAITQHFRVSSPESLSSLVSSLLFPSVTQSRLQGDMYFTYEFLLLSRSR